MKPLLSFLCASALFTCITAPQISAQEPAPQTSPAQTIPGPTATAASPSQACWQSVMNPHMRQLVYDFGWLARFHDADARLGPPTAGENRVVFMGDSITEAWHFDTPGAEFAAKPYINRGISGQTSPQMLVRFRQDVIDLKPKVVVILAGTNDIAGNTGPMTIEQTEENLQSMADLATANHIKVVLCSVLPAFDFPWRPGQDPAPKIDRLNEWMKTYAAQNGYAYVDYHSAMKDQRDGLPPNLSKDGVHPTAAGYAIMAPLVEAGIAKALKR